jgi:hypothetical protein
MYAPNVCVCVHLHTKMQESNHYSSTHISESFHSYMCQFIHSHVQAFIHLFIHDCEYVTIKPFNYRPYVRQATTSFILIHECCIRYNPITV